jgi:hypothetical protein
MRIQKDDRNWGIANSNDCKLTCKHSEIQFINGDHDIQNGLCKRLTKRLNNRTLRSESPSHHWKYELSPDSTSVASTLKKSRCGKLQASLQRWNRLPSDDRTREEDLICDVKWFTFVTTLGRRYLKHNSIRTLMYLEIVFCDFEVWNLKRRRSSLRETSQYPSRDTAFRLVKGWVNSFMHYYHSLTINYRKTFLNGWSQIQRCSVWWPSDVQMNMKVNANLWMDE